MGNFIKTQNSFSNGEVSPEFYATNTVSGVSQLENMDVLQSGALKRRPGLKKIKNVVVGSILVPFEISESEKYLLVIYDSSIDIFQNDTKISTMAAPWRNADLSKLQYVQRFNELFFVHPNYRPRILTKTSSGFNIANFNFYMNPDISINIPFMRFEDTKNISITMSNSNIDNNCAVFTTNADLWDNTWIGVRLLVNDKQWVVESVQDARVATVYTNGNFTIPGTPISDWYETAFGDRRGWPMTISFHQNRLVFGGTLSAPNNVWMSKVGEYNNFDVGTGLEDEAIFTALLSAKHHQICALVSSYALQILTSDGEWAVLNSPLTPSNVDVKQHTSIGCKTTKFLPPQQMDGSTVFVSGKDIRELNLDVLNEKYNAVDLCGYSKHLMNNPVSVAYNSNTHQLFVVMEDGYIAVLNRYANTEISAWTRYTTDGDFKYVCVMNDETYVVVKRGNTNYLEKFDVSVLDDSGEYDFSYRISAFPMIVKGHAPKKIRLRKISLRVKDTKTLFVNDYRMEIPNYIYDESNDGFSGDLSMNLLGTQIDTMQPLWSVSSNEQLPATILSVTTEGNYLI